MSPYSKYLKLRCKLLEGGSAPSQMLASTLAGSATETCGLLLTARRVSGGQFSPVVWITPSDHDQVIDFIVRLGEGANALTDTVRVRVAYRNQVSYTCTDVTVLVSEPVVFNDLASGEGCDIGFMFKGGLLDAPHHTDVASVSFTQPGVYERRISSWSCVDERNICTTLITVVGVEDELEVECITDVLTIQPSDYVCPTDILSATGLTNGRYVGFLIDGQPTEDCVRFDVDTYTTVCVFESNGSPVDGTECSVFIEVAECPQVPEILKCTDHKLVYKGEYLSADEVSLHTYQDGIPMFQDGNITEDLVEVTESSIYDVVIFQNNESVDQCAVYIEVVEECNPDPEPESIILTCSDTVFVADYNGTDYTTYDVVDYVELPEGFSLQWMRYDSVTRGETLTFYGDGLYKIIVVDDEGNLLPEFTCTVHIVEPEPFSYTCPGVVDADTDDVLTANVLVNANGLAANEEFVFVSGNTPVGPTWTVSGNETLRICLMINGQIEPQFECTVSIQIEATVTVYPNPLQKGEAAQIAVTEPGTLTVAHALTGGLRLFHVVEPGTYDFQTNHTFRSGPYIVRLQTISGSFTQRLVLFDWYCLR